MCSLSRFFPPSEILSNSALSARRGEGELRKSAPTVSVIYSKDRRAVISVLKFRGKVNK